MTLNLSSPWLVRLSLPSPHIVALNSFAFSRSLHCSNSVVFDSFSRSPKLNASLKESGSAASAETPVSELLDNDLLGKISGAQDSTDVLSLIADKTQKTEGVVSVSDCCLIISAALDRNNPELALSVLYAMRSSVDPASFNQNGPYLGRWMWSRPDVHVYTLLIQGLAASLRVSDATKIIQNICQVGLSPGEEVVPFGKVVRCPSCMVAVAVAQPQNGIQIVSCAQCRYQYELISGDIISIQSEEISMDVPAWKRGLRFLKLMKQSVPAAVHSIVVQTPSGAARTHRFATETVDLPAQQGERVTIASASPANLARGIGPFKFSPKAPNFYHGEPLCLTNHKDGRESLLLRAPTKEGSSFLLNPSVLFPLLVLLASGDAVSGVIDPSLPQLLTVAGVSSLAAGATFNKFVLPQLNQLPQKKVDAVAIKQQLLSQYDMLQSRIKDLRVAAEKEVWMVARMCQLENKIIAVGEPSYRARRSKIKKVREGLEISLKQRIELIDSYAKISSMIEIEVEMDSDVLAAEAASSMERVAEQIQQIMEIENLEETWRLQAEANDEAERLLSSQPMSEEQV